MRKEIPLFITFIIGLSLVAALFVPHWPFMKLDSEFSMWFDLIAGFAFILGGGNLLKMHLNRISRKHRDRFYSGVTVVAFLGMLIIGLLKIGGDPGLRGNYIAVSNRSSVYTAADLTNPGGLSETLRNSNDAVSVFIRDNLATGTLDMIDRYIETKTDNIEETALLDSLHRALVVDLNAILQNESFYDEDRFREIQLGDHTRSLILEKLALIDLVDSIEALLSEGSINYFIMLDIETILAQERFAELSLTHSVKALLKHYVVDQDEIINQSEEALLKLLDPRELTFELKALLNEVAPGNTHIELNRLLMKAAYPEDIASSYKATWFSVVYDSIFTPLQATMFSLLAFFVASASYRAFRAKTLEATVLLLAAFIILIGRTPLGYYITFWLPDWLDFLKISNLSAWILSTPNLAGQRAIMIGISLGIIATSLKLILGIERGWLGQEK